MQIYSEADFKDSAHPSQQVYSESDFKDAVADNPQFEVAGHSTTATAMPQDQGTGTGPSQDFIRGLMTNQPVNGMAGNIGRSVPATVGGLLGPAGAAAGESMRQVVAQVNAVQNNQEPASPLSVGANVAGAAFLQKAADVASPYVAKATGTVLEGAGDVAKRSLQWLAENLQGVKSASYQYAKKVGANSVARFIGAAPEVGDQLAESARGAVASAISKGEAEYPKLIDAARSNPAYAGKTYDLQTALGDKALQIADEHSLMATPNADALSGSSRYWKQASKLDRMQNASLNDLYRFQRETGQLAQDYAGTNVGAALRKLSTAAKSYTASEVPEIAKANASYAAAKGIEEQTGKLVDNNNLLEFVRRTYANPQSTLDKQALEEAANNVPGLGNIISDIRAYHAAKDFSPLLRQLPQTGMGSDIAKYATGGVGVGLLGLAHSNPILGAAGMGLTGAIGVATSPRVALMALKGSQAAAPALAAGASGAVATAKASTPLITQALGRMSAGSIAAYYQSPGVQP